MMWARGETYNNCYSFIYSRVYLWAIFTERVHSMRVRELTEIRRSHYARVRESAGSVNSALFCQCVLQLYSRNAASQRNVGNSSCIATVCGCVKTVK